MEILIKLSASDLATLAKDGSVAVHTNLSEDAPKPRGRPAGAKNKPKDVEADVDDDVTEDDEDEAPAPAKKKKPAPVAVVADEDDDEDDSDDEDDDDEEIEDEEDFVTGDDLAKLKKALTAFSKAKGSKDAAVKVLRKFAPSSEKVKASDLGKLLKALKV